MDDTKHAGAGRPEGEDAGIGHRRGAEDVPPASAGGLEVGGGGSDSQILDLDLGGYIQGHISSSLPLP